MPPAVAHQCLVKGRLCPLAAARNMHGGTLAQVCEALREGVAELEGALSQLERDRVLAEPGGEPPGDNAAAHVSGSGSAADAGAGREGGVVVGQAYRRVTLSVPTCTCCTGVHSAWSSQHSCCPQAVVTPKLREGVAPERICVTQLRTDTPFHSQLTVAVSPDTCHQSLHRFRGTDGAWYDGVAVGVEGGHALLRFARPTKAYQLGAVPVPAAALLPALPAPAAAPLPVAGDRVIVLHSG